MGGVKDHPQWRIWERTVPSKAFSIRPGDLNSLAPSGGLWGVLHSRREWCPWLPPAGWSWIWRWGPGGPGWGGHWRTMQGKEKVEKGEDGN